ncbi:MAG: carbohydrate ABC transporter substrate-binding protein [Methylobacteriaceae bacterium]|nr:carbohydrate ABC transporter substrate-binding protein [Methylobacteriaceae bacterium]MBV9705751.1 carbohydrate ABC transporter substrate-binding protein [Methylobacteriaceae bacterium]
MTNGINGFTRRRLLQSSAVLGAGAASASLLPQWTLAAGESPLRAQSGKTVYFRGWQYHPEIVQSNVDRYNSELNGKVDYATVTGDYPQLMEKNLIANADLDMLYANPSFCVRYFEGGWLATPDQLAIGKEVADAMYPNIRDAWSYKGKLLGLSYYTSTRGMIHVNLEKYKSAGFDEGQYPKTWMEFYDFLYKIRDKGEKQPYLPAWFNEWAGISWAYNFEVLNRGGMLADPETHKPMLTADGPAGQTLEAWKKIWKDGFVPEEVLSYNEAALIDAFRSGRYVFSSQTAYDLRELNDPAKSAAVAGKISFLPNQGQPWGSVDGALYLMTSRKRPDDVTEDVKRFVSWYGYKDQNGKIAVGRRWLETSMLFSAYKELMESPDAADIIRKGLARPQDYEPLLKIYQTANYPKGVWNVVWAEEFNGWLKEKLSAFLLQDLAVEDTVKETNDKIDQLNQKYKI